MVPPPPRISLSHKIESYKRFFKYEEPFYVICDPDFVGFVLETLGLTLEDALETLLGGEVQLMTTYCIRGALKELGYKVDMRVNNCVHEVIHRKNPIVCMRTWATKFPGRRLVICTIKDAAFYKEDPALIVVTNDGERSLMVDSVASKHLSYEFETMDEFNRLMGFRPPFSVVCDPGFVRYIQGLGKKSLVESLQHLLLSGKILLLHTECMRSEMLSSSLDTSSFKEAGLRDCHHKVHHKEVQGPCSQEFGYPKCKVKEHHRLTARDCMRRFVKNFNKPGLVICSADDIDHYRQVPGTILVTPKENSPTGMQAASVAETVFNMFEIRKKTAAKSTGKRDAAEIIEKQVASSKKQKVDSSSSVSEEEPHCKFVAKKAAVSAKKFVFEGYSSDDSPPSEDAEEIIEEDSSDDSSEDAEEIIEEDSSEDTEEIIEKKVETKDISSSVSEEEPKKMVENMRGLQQAAEEKSEASLDEPSPKHQQQKEAQLAEESADRTKATETVSSLQPAFSDEPLTGSTFMAGSSCSSSKRIKLQSFEGEIFEVDELVASQSLLIKDMIGDGITNVDAVCSFRTIKSATFRKIIQYCKKHVEAQDAEEELRAFDAEFVKVEHDTMFDLIEAARYLNIKGLLDLMFKAVGDLMQGQTIGQICLMFNIKNDYTQDQLNEVRRSWRSTKSFQARIRR